MIWRWLKVATLGAALVLTGAPTLERVDYGAGEAGTTADGAGQPAMGSTATAIDVIADIHDDQKCSLRHLARSLQPFAQHDKGQDQRHQTRVLEG